MLCALDIHALPGRQVPRTIAGGRFKVLKILGSGAFGTVYSATDRESGRKVAVKFESTGFGAPTLKHEAEMLKFLREPTRPQGFAEHFYFGEEMGSQVLVMEILGRDLDKCFQACQGSFQVQTVVLLAEQLMQRLEYLHSKRVVHRDIKPENFAFGVREKRHHLYMIDFGLCKKYYEARHKPMRYTSSFIGTARYASVNAHRQLQQSRRDDLQAVGHMLIYFLRGSLPWSGLHTATTAQKMLRIRQLKESIPVDELCGQFPREFALYFNYCRGLGFTEQPNYTMIRQLFQGLRARLSKQAGRPIEDQDFEWTVDHGHLELLNLTATYEQPDHASHTRRWLRGLICTSTKLGANPSVPEPLSAKRGAAKWGDQVVVGSGANKAESCNVKEEKEDQDEVLQHRLTAAGA